MRSLLKSGVFRRTATLFRDSVASVRRFLTKERHIRKPYLDLFVRLPYFEARTDLMMESFERDVYEYIGLYMKVFRWQFKFRLYEPGVAKAERLHLREQVRAKDRPKTNLAHKDVD